MKSKFLVFRRHFLSFIEILIAIAMVSVIATVIGFNVNKAIKEQRFRSEVGYVVEKLRLAQNLMLILNEDVKVRFSRETGGYRCALSFQCPANKGWDKELTRPSPLMTGITHIDLIQKERQDSNDFELDFLSGGTVMSQGVLSLSSAASARSICLHGYPHPIQATSRVENTTCLQDFGNDKQHLTQFIVPEIKAKLAVHGKDRIGQEIPKL